MEDLLSREQFLTSSNTSQPRREPCAENASPMILELECLDTSIDHSTDNPAMEAVQNHDDESIQETQFEPHSSRNKNLL